MPLLREDQAFISVQLGGVNALDAEDVAITLPGLPAGWTSLEGGDVEAEDVFTRPGGMRPGINLGGPSKRSDATVKVQYSTDFNAIISTLEGLAGKRSMAVSWTPLDADMNPNGSTTTITGVLKQVMRPNFDANASAVGFLQLVMGCNV
jgi:hypothetical protein